MKLKYLTFSLFALSLTACSQHVIKSTQNKSATVEQDAVSAMNAMFETSGFDYRGKTTLQAKSTEPAKSSKNADHQTRTLEPELRRQLEQYLTGQGVKLSAEQKSLLFSQLAQEQSSHTDRSADASSRFLRSAVNILNDLKFDYEGSVHYRDRLATLNMNVQYLKPTLQIQAQLPMIADLKNYRFYTNYFALMPFLVNSESQDTYAYVDFSRFKGDIEKVDIKKFAEYLRQMNAVPFVLADQGQLRESTVTAQDQKLGIHRKIRYQGDMETLMMQMAIFETVNRDYVQKQILKITDTEQAAEKNHAESEVQDNDGKGGSDESLSLAQKAYDSEERVAELVNSRLHELMYHHDDHEYAKHAEAEAESQGNDSSAAYAAAAATDAAPSDEDMPAEHMDSEEQQSVADATAEQSDILSREACYAIQTAGSAVPMGSVSQCQYYYGIRVLKEAEQKKQATAPGMQAISALISVEPLFSPYQQRVLMTAQDVKTLWHKHQAEIQQMMAGTADQRTPLVLDIGMDAQGRLIQLDTHVDWKSPETGKISLLNQLAISNYGHATAIDRKLMQNARSIDEVSKGSMFEKMVKSFTGSLEPSSTDQKASGKTDSKSLEKNIAEIAEQTFTRTGSEVRTYQAVFVPEMTKRYPELLKHYSTAQLNEISEVYAYYFMEEKQEQLKGKALQRLEALQKKHQLIRSDQFDDAGASIEQVVADAVKQVQAQQKWAKLKKQFGTEQAVFAQYYMQLFSADYEMNAEQQQNLKAVAAVLAQAYMDDRKGRLTKASVKNLKAAHDGFYDGDLYRKAYTDVIENLNP
ncbi:hypothetical protein CDG60_16185 [Acinetobacter chinensis]|uniref:Lipoprotein n=1 Tax=Acinetobacter chinensis TaxID=2004650 RepID=A0A3B7M5M0_9GAMM|nr:hypothetical protein [Acinetobacter chinensis]AXY57963.1 hypothetical protein CDG60_16185 [Acinetobacter chinensis]